MFVIKRRCALPVALVASSIACALAATPASAEDPSVHAGLSGPVKAWKQAMESGDIAAMSRMHDASTTSFPPGGMEVTGADVIMKGYAETFATFAAKVQFGDAHWVEEPPLVVSWGLFTLTLHPKAGGPDIVTHGRFTDAAIKTDSGWRYVVDHASVPRGK